MLGTMPRDWDTFHQWEKEQQRRESPDFQRNLAILEQMLVEAVALGAFPPTNPLEGLEVTLRIARVVNSVPSAA
jgi:hypothetical protein